MMSDVSGTEQLPQIFLWYYFWFVIVQLLYQHYTFLREIPYVGIFQCILLLFHPT